MASNHRWSNALDVKGTAHEDELPPPSGPSCSEIRFSVSSPAKIQRNKDPSDEGGIDKAEKKSAVFATPRALMSATVSKPSSWNDSVKNPAFKHRKRPLKGVSSGTYIF